MRSEELNKLLRYFVSTSQDWDDFSNLSKSTFKTFHTEGNQCGLKEFKKASEVAEKVLGQRDK